MLNADRAITVPVFIVAFLSVACAASADTVYLKEKGAIKGIIVEDYVDRIFYSTIDGEKEILKQDILKIEYDEPIDNLTNMGNSAFEKGYYKEALKYYLMAQQLNPNITTLNNKIYHTEITIYKTPEIKKRDQIAIKNEIISGYVNAPSSSSKITPDDALKKDLGISLSAKKGGRFYVDGLAKDSPFKKAGVRKGDAIVAVWSKLCDYLNLKELHDLLAKSHEAMVMITIERNVVLPKGNSPLGAKLEIKWEGAVLDVVYDKTVAKKAGLKQGDLLVQVAKKSIRYTPLKTVMDLLNLRDSKTIITIRRRLTVFKST